MENLNFNYTENSPCINAGNPYLFDQDGSARDIGANIYTNLILGDCNSDDEISISDIIYIINTCILEINSGSCNCSDINQDGATNISDIIMLVNIILR